MEDRRSNSSDKVMCETEPTYVMMLSLIDIVPLLLGQPVIAKLLWITFVSKKATDILNCNLALFHNLQYLIAVVHLVILFLRSDIQQKILKFLLVYAQIGGPMSLSFICMERYVAVIHPMSYPLLRKYRFREVCVVVVWLSSVTMALMNVMLVDAFPDVRENVIKLLPLWWLLVMIEMMVQCTISIARTLRKSGPGGGEKMHPVKNRAFKTICATSAIVLMCYTPVAVLQQFKFDDEFTYYCVIMPTCILLLSAASVVHPLFYLSAQGKLFPFLK